MAEDVIILDNVSKKYPSFEKDKTNLSGSFKRFFIKDKFCVLNKINLNIKEGEQIAILGKNGAGKTILLKIIAGIISPDSGRLEVKKCVSPLFGYGLAFWGNFSCVENINTHGSLLGVKKKRVYKEIDNIIKFSELEKFKNLELKHFSPGMKVRLSFSIASLLKPEILILDETLSSVDKSFIDKAYDKILSLKENGMTTIITSHSPEILKRFCKRGYVLDKGEIVFYGEINEAIDYYEKHLSFCNHFSVSSDGTKSKKEESIAREKNVTFGIKTAIKR